MFGYIICVICCFLCRCVHRCRQCVSLIQVIARMRKTESGWEFFLLLCGLTCSSCRLPYCCLRKVSRFLLGLAQERNFHEVSKVSWKHGQIMTTKPPLLNGSLVDHYLWLWLLKSCRLSPQLPAIGSLELSAEVYATQPIQTNTNWQTARTEAECKVFRMSASDAPQASVAVSVVKSSDHHGLEVWKRRHGQVGLGFAISQYLKIYHEAL